MGIKKKPAKNKRNKGTFKNNKPKDKGENCIIKCDWEKKRAKPILEYLHG
mgnify:CR=1 FL=1